MKFIPSQAKANYISDNPGTLEHEVPVLAGPKVPDPVFFCTIEPPSSSKEKALESALKCLQREDPSLKVEPNDEGQFVLSGMGELHLEVSRLITLSINNFISIPFADFKRSSIEGIQNRCIHWETPGRIS